MTEKNRLLITRLKQVRKEKEYSYQYIVDECERNGDSVSMSAVRRIFMDGSEDMGFRYSTIRPVAVVVLGLDEVTHSEAPTPDEADALRALIAIKDKQIEDLHRTISEKSTQIAWLVKVIDGLTEKQDHHF